MGLPGKDEAVELSKEPLMVEGVSGGQLDTYGSNKYQQLGREAGQMDEPGAISLEDLAEVTQVLAACGSNHSAFVVDGQLHTYGSNKYQQLGREAGQMDEPGAISLEDISDVTQVSLGAQHSAAINASG